MLAVVQLSLLFWYLPCFDRQNRSIAVFIHEFNDTLTIKMINWNMSET